MSLKHPDIVCVFFVGEDISPLNLPKLAVLLLVLTMGIYLWKRMNYKLANGMKMWKGNKNTTTLLFSLIGLEILHQVRRSKWEPKWCNASTAQVGHRQENGERKRKLPFNPISRIDTHFFKIHSNNLLPSTARLS